MHCQNCNTKDPVIDGIPRFHTTTRGKIIEFNKIVNPDPRRWNVWRRNNYFFFQKQIKDINSSSLLLDIGAGTAPFSNLLGSFNNIKIDFQPYRGIDLLTDLNKKLPFADASFDAIIMSNLLEHIPEPQALLNECHRILKNEGKLLITVPFLIKVHQPPYDFLRYTEYMLERMLLRSGFSEVAVEKIGNVFDVHQILFGRICSKLIENSGNNKFKQIAVKIYRLLFNYSLKAILAITDPKEKDKVDIMGYPHGYGCIAQK